MRTGGPSRQGVDSPALLTVYVVLMCSKRCLARVGPAPGQFTMAMLGRHCLDSLLTMLQCGRVDVVTLPGCVRHAGPHTLRSYLPSLHSSISSHTACTFVARCVQGMFAEAKNKTLTFDALSANISAVADNGGGIVTGLKNIYGPRESINMHAPVNNMGRWRQTRQTRGYSRCRHRCAPALSLPSSISAKPNGAWGMDGQPAQSRLLAALP